jgi:hypothetical protein
MSEVSGKRIYTLAEAASLAQVSEEELLGAIKDGGLVARFAPDTGQPIIEANELTYFMRRTRRGPAPAEASRRRIAIIDDDTQFSETLKLELGLDKRLEARAATWSNDGARLLEAYAPHLCLLKYRPMDPVVEPIAKLMARPAFRAKCLVSAYTAGTLVPDRMVEVGVFLSAFGLQTVLSSATGTKAIIVKCCELLGLENRTQIRRFERDEAGEPD